MKTYEIEMDAQEINEVNNMDVRQLQFLCKVSSIKYECNNGVVTNALWEVNDEN
jgi:hypothetical protein